MPISIAKVSNIDNEQEKLKGKGVVVAGSVYTKKDEENLENENEGVVIEATKIDADGPN